MYILVLMSVSRGVLCAAMMQKQPNVPVEALNPAMSNAVQRTSEVLELTQKLVVTLICHPRLPGWLGQVWARRKREATEGSPEDESQADGVVEEIITSDENGPETPNNAHAEECNALW